MYKYNLSLLASAHLLNAITDTDTEIQVQAGQGALFTQPPCVAALVPNRSQQALKDAEHIIIRSRVGDVLTVEREIIGTAGSYAAGYQLLGLWSPEHIEHIYEFQEMVEFFLKGTLGRGLDDSVVDFTDNSFDLSIVSGMTVEIEPGACFSSGNLFSKTTATQLTFVAPTVSTRRDIIQANPNLRKLEIKKGVEGSGTFPTADTDCLALWRGVITVAMTTVTLPDFTSVRPI